MKKHLLLILLFSIMLMTTNCNNEGDNHNHFIEDLRHLHTLLQNNFALYDVAYWAHGVNIGLIFENLESEVLNNPNINEAEFFNLLVYNFQPLHGIGHFRVISPSAHHSILYIEHPNVFRVAPWTWERLNAPHVMAFYEPRHPDASKLIESITEDAKPLILDSLIAGHIAYLAVPYFTAFNHNSDELDTRILDFFHSIQDYNHLIIDLRGNHGGWPQSFFYSVISPNIESSLIARGFTFFQRGHIVEPYAIFMNTVRYGFGSTPGGIMASDTRLQTAATILENNYLPDANLRDFERLQYGFPTRMVISPRQIPYLKPFRGEIWLLTDRYMFSGAQIAAWAIKDTGFATLVGEVTGGVYGGQRTFVDMPNTGIIFEMDIFYVTDKNGRPLEAGTIPHHFNKPNMNALETAFEMFLPPY